MGKLRPGEDEAIQEPWARFHFNWLQRRVPTRGTVGVHVTSGAGRSWVPPARCPPRPPGVRLARLRAAWPLLCQTGWASPAHLLGAALPQPAGGATDSLADWDCLPTCGRVGGETHRPRAKKRYARAGPTGAVQGTRRMSSLAAQTPSLSPTPAARSKSPRPSPPAGPEKTDLAIRKGPGAVGVTGELRSPILICDTQSTNWSPFTDHVLCAKHLLATPSINLHSSRNYENKIPSKAWECLSPCPPGIIEPRVSMDQPLPS